VHKYLPISPSPFNLNRKNLSAALPGGSLAVFNSNDIMPTNADGHMGFKQNSDLFYLSGIDQEETILVIFPSARDAKMREVLFIRETNEHIAVWEGHKYTKQEAREASGVESIYWTSQFQQIFNQLMAEAEMVFLNSNEHLRAVIEVETRDARFQKWCQEKYPLHQYRRVAPLMHRLRSVKSEWEIELIQKACNITGQGFRRLLNFVKPGVWEYEIEAELLHEFVRNRSKGFAYGPIIASGANACVLHYTANNQMCREGEVILLDVAAEYANYASDLTRCIPVSGRFTERQKAVYNAVLRVLKAATLMLVPGNTIEKYHAEVGKLMEQELIGLGLLKAEEVARQNPDAPLYKKYFMHGTSHFLGLDVHDVGDFKKPIEAGMVFTCEPGIYIPEEQLGIRLENDILVTHEGPVNLMAHIPIEADEIESLMAGS
jgi:Xaa-Pro aminopeptidase